MSSTRLLRGLRVVDLADERGELCGRLLADLGADVIRIEPPGGARSRALPPLHDGQSLYFAYRNMGKRGLALELDDPAGRAELHRQLAGSDAMLESFPPGWLRARDLAPAALIERHPHLIVTSITDFGQTGPYRDRVATSAVVDAMSGQMWRAGAADREPLIPPGAFGHDIAATTAAYATLLACHQRLRSGAGQHIDLSALEAGAQCTDWSYPAATLARNQGDERVEKREGSGAMYPIYRCRDGFVRLVIFTPRQWRAMWEWLGSPEAFADPYWELLPSRLTNGDVLAGLYEAHFAPMAMRDICVQAQGRGIACTPVLTPDQVLENEHLVARGSFVEAEIAPGLRARVAAGFHEIDGERAGARGPAPALDEHGAALRAEPLVPRAGQAAIPLPAAPLEGVRVLDFGVGGVGTEGGRMLAEYGADVIKVESSRYPDFIRVIRGSEMSWAYASSNRSKRGFGLNLRHPGGRRILRELVRRADVVIENYATGKQDDLGIGWADVQRMNPRCSMVSSQLLGSRGPWAHWTGYGPSTQPMGGMVHLWSYPDASAPAGGGSAFPDHLTGRHVALLAVAALLERERSDRGHHCEAAQVETVTGMLGDLLLLAALEPGSVGPLGNRSQRGAPWGAYPCAGDDQWCVITVRDDADWAALCRALGSPDWASDDRWRTAQGRLAGQVDLDACLGSWTRSRDKYAVARELQAAGVPAGPMLTARETLDDAHFAARRFERPVAQPGLGLIGLDGPAFRAMGMPDARVEAAPRVGEHTREICRDVLVIPDGELEALIDEGVLEVRPPDGAGRPAS